MLRKNTASQFVHIAGVNVSTGAIVTGATWTMRRCLDGTFAAGGATVTEDGSTGFYKVALTQADTNGNDIGYFFTATSCVPVTLNVLTTAADPSDSVRLGLTALPNAAAEAAGGLYTRGTGAGQIAQDANGNVRVNVDTIKTNPVVNAGTVTFPTGATLASTTNITAGVITTVTTVTNQLTAAAIATGVWQDTTAGDFTTALSIGKSIMNGVSLGTGLTVAAVSGAVGSVTGAVGSVTGAVGSVTGAVGSVTGNVGGNVVGSVASVTAAVALTAGERNSVADAILGRNVAGGSSSGRIVSEALYTLRNKVAIAAGTMTVYATDDSTAAFTAAVTTVAGNPISVIDPA